jgi:hypothetical protein
MYAMYAMHTVEDSLLPARFARFGFLSENVPTTTAISGSGSTIGTMSFIYQITAFNFNNSTLYPTTSRYFRKVFGIFFRNRFYISTMNCVIQIIPTTVKLPSRSIFRHSYHVQHHSIIEHLIYKHLVLF